MQPVSVFTLLLATISIAISTTAQTQSARENHVGIQPTKPKIDTLTNFDFSDRIYPFMSFSKRRVDGVQYSFSGKSGPCISKTWILAHPQLIPSLEGYTVLGFELSWLPRGRDYEVGGLQLAKNNGICQLVSSFNPKDSSWIFLDNILLEKNGEAVAPTSRYRLFKFRVYGMIVEATVMASKQA